ncbi:MAG TPA: c-type cytochrome domain-containing protein [Polyangiaceae bacterium]|nr:c-type cytochrome domain-containing protein [Polyangiaceae bacterium]
MKRRLTPILWLVLVGTLASSCHDDGMIIAEELPEPVASDQGAPAALDATAIETAAAQRILISNCASCHGPAVSEPPHSAAGAAERYGSDGIADIADIDALIDDGLIVPGFPEESPLLLLIASAQMPPSSSGLPPVSDAQIRRLEKFIVSLNPPTESEVVEILLRYCSGCHTGGSGGVVLPINAIGDISVLVAGGLIVPGDRDQSEVYRRILDEEMPPPNAELPYMSNRELARLGGYIDLLR